MECLYNTFISNKNKSHCNCCHHFALFGPDSVFSVYVTCAHQRDECECVEAVGAFGVLG